MYESVEDSLFKASAHQALVPVFDRPFAHNERSAPVTADLEHFEEVATLGVGDWCEPAVVEDQQVGVYKPGKQLCVGAVGARQRHLRGVIPRGSGARKLMSSMLASSRHGPPRLCLTTSSRSVRRERS